MVEWPDRVTLLTSTAVVGLRHTSDVSMGVADREQRQGYVSILHSSADTFSEPIIGVHDYDYDDHQHHHQQG